ncbi:mycothiol system anti-sigma-R factor [Miniimonas sp. S16]|uniref:mycothiol system anti-sigma-R factor n=1 Tax=Miniimonas sp. S16 TaxID=2171623 RepID=UPI000D525FE3|nr:mycothiol system anti-sigma-R factor [Miniimonas sp. S16]
MTAEQTGAPREPRAEADEREVSQECRAALEHLAELLDHAMADSDADVLRAHIEACDPCTEAADAEEHVRALIRRACVEKAPSQLRVRIVSQLVVRTSR